MCLVCLRKGLGGWIERGSEESREGDICEYKCSVLVACLIAVTHLTQQLEEGGYHSLGQCIMAGKAWRQELVVSGHIVSVSGSQEMNPGSNHSLPFIQSGTPDDGIVPHIQD